MELNEYQRRALETANYPQGEFGLSYVTLGLCGEAGEVSNQVKKIYRGDDITDDEVEKREFMIIEELGDCLWYISALASELRIELDVIAQLNIEKLRRRYA